MHLRFGDACIRSTHPWSVSYIQSQDGAYLPQGLRLPDARGVARGRSSGPDKMIDFRCGYRRCRGVFSLVLVLEPEDDALRHAHREQTLASARVDGCSIDATKEQSQPGICFSEVRHVELSGFRAIYFYSIRVPETPKTTVLHCICSCHSSILYL